MITNKVLSFFKKNQINENNIAYLYRENNKTSICLTDGRKVFTYTPVKVILNVLDKDSFININKSITLKKSQILDINDGLYTMADGKTFKGRGRTPLEHRNNQKLIAHPGCKLTFNPQSIEENFAILDRFPLPFCVIELLFDKEGHGVDFVIRYCNQEMEKFEGLTLQQMVNHSFYELFTHIDKKWLITYADVALNGTTKTIEEFNSRLNTNLTVQCYQPAHGYCGCLILKNL